MPESIFLMYEVTHPVIDTMGFIHAGRRPSDTCPRLFYGQWYTPSRAASF